MRYLMDYYFTDGGRSVPLATFHFDGKKISFRIKYRGERIDAPFFDPADLARQLENLIRLPLMRSELRSRTMPGFFKKLTPNTLEHFQAIRHDSTYFKFSDIRGMSRSGSDCFDRPVAPI